MSREGDVERAIQGDRQAFSRLYGRYSRAVFLDLVARLRLREDAEDALQATFLAAWASLPRLADPARFVPWLFKIARNKARDQGRRDRLRLVRRLEEEDLVAPAGGDPVEVELLKELMLRLRPETRSIVFLRGVEGWTAEEVAASQGVSTATVRRRYAGALADLRERLSRRLEDGQEPRHRKTRRARL